MDVSSMETHDSIDYRRFETRILQLGREKERETSVQRAPLKGKHCG